MTEFDMDFEKEMRDERRLELIAQSSTNTSQEEEELERLHELFMDEMSVVAADLTGGREPQAFFIGMIAGALLLGFIITGLELFVFPSN